MFYTASSEFIFSLSWWKQDSVGDDAFRDVMLG